MRSSRGSGASAMRGGGGSRDATFLVRRSQGTRVMTSAPALGSASDVGDLPTSELLTHGRTALDWIARYLDHPERVSVLSQVVPGEIRQMLPVSPPEQPEPLGDISAISRRRSFPASRTGTIPDSSVISPHRR